MYERDVGRQRSAGVQGIELEVERRAWLRRVVNKREEIHQLSNYFPGKWLKISEGNMI